ncbi:MAG: diaminopimelate epimerase, partial [Oligosphaeraceae bacterium]|nr:diaminopimelate epimerase [Oligosphaeraceae bacterium]
KINVQFLQVKDRHNIAIEIWERGAGYTLASGSSASACAAVAVKLGLCQSPVTVWMPGGQLQTSISADFQLTQTGPVKYVFTALWPE